MPVTNSMNRCVLALAAMLGCAVSAFAQQRPLQTEDPETIGSGRALIEAGIDYDRDVYLPVSGLRGNLTTMPSFGVSLGVSSIAEIQFDWGVVSEAQDHRSGGGSAVVPPAAARWRHDR